MAVVAAMTMVAAGERRLAHKFWQCQHLGGSVAWNGRLRWRA